MEWTSAPCLGPQFRLGLASTVLTMAIVAACGSSTSSPIGGGPGPNGSDAAVDGRSTLSDAGTTDGATATSADGGADAPHAGPDANAADGAGGKAGDSAVIGSADAAAIIIPPLSASCSQSVADKTTPPSTTSFIYPLKPVTPFYQWINNNGYCGEVSMMQAGMNNGQWSSQFNARLLCGGENDASEPLSQAGADADCDQSAQLLLDNVSADRAPLCLTNFGLANEIYDYTTEPTGTPGYQNFMAWIKARTIAGDNVAIGILDSNGNDSEYDHIVTIVKIGTNHATTDSTYYDDDVLYFDDHGLLTFENGANTGNPSIPPGTGTDTTGCTPYVFGYAFSALASTATAAHASSAHAYSIVIPGSGNNYGFAVSGPVGLDAGAELLPVTLAIAGSATTGTANLASPLVGYNYENPYIGTKDDGTSCTNSPPASWMTLSLEATVNGLTAGTTYNLYEYDFGPVTGVGSAAALALPTSAFNAHASQATATTSFVATGGTYTYVVPPRSANQTIVFRAVPASAP